MRNKGFFASPVWQGGMRVMYGLGAAIVILGALFKILHWEFATEMLIVGMTTEAVIFFVSIFEPSPHEWHWDRVYPQLNRDPEEAELEGGGAAALPGVPDGAAAAYRDALVRLEESCRAMATVQQSAVRAAEFERALAEAGTGLAAMQTGFADAARGLQAVAQATQAAPRFHDALNAIVPRLDALAGEYAAHQNDLADFRRYAQNLKATSDALHHAAPDAQALRLSLAELKTQVEGLSQMYARMLAAGRA